MTFKIGDKVYSYQWDVVGTVTEIRHCAILDCDVDELSVDPVDRPFRMFYHTNSFELDNGESESDSTYMPGH